MITLQHISNSFQAMKLGDLMLYHHISILMVLILWIIILIFLYFVFHIYFLLHMHHSDRILILCIQMPYLNKI